MTQHFYYSQENISVLCNTMNKEIKEVCNWFKAHMLSLNATKTNLMFLGKRMQTQNINNNIAIYLDGCILKRVLLNYYSRI